MNEKRKPYQSATPAFGPAGKFYLLVGMSLIILGIYSIIDLIKNVALLESSGTVTQADVIDLRIDREIGDSNSYYIKYQFEAHSPDDGGLHQYGRVQNTDRFLYNYVDVGGKIEIIYVAEDPESTWILGTEPSYTSSIFFSALLVGGSVLIFLGVQDILKAR